MNWVIEIIKISVPLVIAYVWAQHQYKQHVDIRLELLENALDEAYATLHVNELLLKYKDIERVTNFINKNKKRKFFHDWERFHLQDMIEHYQYIIYHCVLEKEAP